MNYERTVRPIPEDRPIDALLAGYAAKTLPPVQTALIAAHLELKPANRRFVAALEAVQGVFLEELKPVPLPGRDRRLVNIFSSPDPDPEPVPAPLDDVDPVLPRALRRLTGCDYASLPWRRRPSGLQEVILAGDPTGSARFLSVAPGQRLPIPRDESAAALVLLGAASDPDGYYERGDVIFPGRNGAPGVTAESGTDCVCFIVGAPAARAASPLSRVLHLVTGG